MTSTKNYKIYENIKIVATFFIIALITILLNNAKIHGTDFNVFGVSFAIALLIINLNAFKFIIPYFIGSIVVNITLTNLLVVLTESALIILIFLLSKKVKIKNERIKFVIYSILLVIPKIVFNFSKNEKFVVLIFLCVIAIFLSCAIITSLKAFLKRHLKNKYLIDEKISFYIFWFVLCLGVSNFCVANFNLVFLVALIVAMIGSRFFDNNETIILNALAGVSLATATMQLEFCVLFCLYALVGMIFKNVNAFVTLIAVMVCDVFFNAFFIADVVFKIDSLIACLVIGIINLCITKKRLGKIKQYFFTKYFEYSEVSYIEKERAIISNKLFNISNIFKEMQNVFLQMVKTNISDDELKRMIADEISVKLCGGCINRKKCYFVNGKETTEFIDAIIETAYRRGKATLLDVPPYLASGCEKINTIINKINELLKSSKQGSVITENLNSSRLLIADELGGISNILEELGVISNKGVQFDEVVSNIIKEDLAYSNMLCVSATAIKNKNWYNFVLCIQGSYDNNNIIQVLNNVVKRKCEIINIEDGLIPTQKIIYAQSKPELDFVFGKASKNKSGNIVCGDSKTVIKVDEGKYLIAVGDGMGSGTDANKTSSLAISLIENFYKAGFSHDIIINSVNKLLNNVLEESYSTLDLCALDFYAGNADFIKLGAPYSLIKRNNKIIELQKSGLPIGAVDSVSPVVTKELILCDDLIVLISDGVSDLFDIEKLKEFILNTTKTNPQSLAEEILNIALQKVDGFANDDMTIIVLKIFKN